MKKVLSVFLIIAATHFHASAQEPVGKQQIGDMPTDSLPTIVIPQDSEQEGKLSPAFDFGIKIPDIPESSSISNPTGTYKPIEKTDLTMPVDIPTTNEMPVKNNPKAYDFKSEGVVKSWENGALTGGSYRETAPGLLSRQNVSLGITQNVDNFTFSLGTSVDRYMLARRMKTIYGINGAITYNFNSNISATIFGQYYNNNPYYSMAAMPYIGTSRFGGFFTLQGETLGIDLGVQRYYDTYARRWTTSPIITPKIKFNNNFTLALPVGELVKDILDDYIFNSKKNNGPMIMPNIQSVPSIPFSSPDIPYQK